MRAVRHHMDCKWVLLYIERWLKAPVSMPDGTLVSRERGTPQGSVVTPRTQKVTLGGWRTVQLTWSGRATAGRGRRRNRNTVADNDSIVADKDLLDDQTHD